MREPLIEPEHVAAAPQAVSFRPCFFWGGDSEKVLRESRNARMVCAFFGGEEERGRPQADFWRSCAAMFVPTR